MGEGQREMFVCGEVRTQNQLLQRDLRKSASRVNRLDKQIEFATHDLLQAEKFRRPDQSTRELKNALAKLERARKLEITFQSKLLHDIEVRR